MEESRGVADVLVKLAALKGGGSGGRTDQQTGYIGTTTGTYTVPWGYSSTDYIPLQFTISAPGTGSGHITCHATLAMHKALLPAQVKLTIALQAFGHAIDIRHVIPGAP